MWVGAKSAIAVRKAEGLRRPRRHSKIAGDADITDEDAPVEQRLPRGVAVTQVPEKHEIGVTGHRLQAHRRQLADDPIALCLDGVDRVEHELGVGERGQRHRLRLRAEVVRHAHQAERIDQVRVGTRYPSRAPARAKALLIVRVTTSPGDP